MVCSPPAIKLADGSTLCTKGVAYCHGGVYSDCRYIQQYELAEAKDSTELESVPGVDRVGSIQRALISPPTSCDACHPDCFKASDRPVDTDLVSTNSKDAAYDATAGGIKIKSLVDAIQRGSGTGAICGNRLLESTNGGVEKCDDGNIVSNDGCSSQCLIEAGWFCTTQGQPCTRSVCGNAVPEGDEQCDDGNKLIGDGCTFQCKREPTCAAGSCTPVCGDGNIYPGEACDDGNTTNDDGCSSTCTTEAGFSCVNSSANPPTTFALPIVYRDFIALPINGGVRHPDFENVNASAAGLVKSNWGTDKKPVYNGGTSFSNATNFNQWYNDVAGVNQTFADTLTVTRQSDGTYYFDSTNFFNLDGRTGSWVSLGKENRSSNHNFGFTSEVRFWFQYTSGQTLSFRGDDDVWVFINGKLAVDLGGVHGPQSGAIILNSLNEGTLGLQSGKLYEAAVFQAERHTTGSNYRLTLGGFFFGRTTCASMCGNGIVTSDEFCDDGANNGVAGYCQTNCQGRLPKYNPTASYWRDYTATGTCRIPPQRPLWGNLTYTKGATTTNGGSVSFKLQGAETAAALATAASTTVSTTNASTSGTINIQSALNAAGLRDDSPYLRVTALMTSSSDQTSTPMLQQFDVPYTCVNVE